MLGWIHEGTVRHRRYVAKPHDFRMRLRMPCQCGSHSGGVPAVEVLVVESRKFGHWQQRDFGFEEHRSIGDEIRDRIHRTLGLSDISNVLATHPRYFGHQFNPVSFYFAHNTEGVLQAIVTEITKCIRGEF